jgi:hypothetical protein
MKWLLTVPAGTDLGELRQALAAHGVILDSAPPIPLDAGEHVVEAEGPRDLPALLDGLGLQAIKASPSSELELYDAIEGDG